MRNAVEKDVLRYMASISFLCVGAQMRESMASKHQEIVSERFGEQMPMQIKFREVDPFNLWVRF